VQEASLKTVTVFGKLGKEREVGHHKYVKLKTGDVKKKRDKPELRSAMKGQWNCWRVVWSGNGARGGSESKVIVKRKAR
jgi:hypothetical protein